MKIVDRKTFLAMPCPTFFTIISKSTGPDATLRVKVDGDENDFIQIMIPDFPLDDDMDAIKAEDSMIKQMMAGAAFPMSLEETGWYRNAYSDGMFCVLERQDLLRLRGLIDAGIEAAK